MRLTLVSRPRRGKEEQMPNNAVITILSKIPLFLALF
jgi:hypothetical protein